MSSSGGETGASGAGGAANPADKDKLDALYEEREPKKLIRIITVTAYMVSVSFVGIALSAYYVFLWHPPNPRLMHSQAMSAHSEARLGPTSIAGDEVVGRRGPGLAPLLLLTPPQPPPPSGPLPRLTAVQEPAAAGPKARREIAGERRNRTETRRLFDRIRNGSSRSSSSSSSAGTNQLDDLADASLLAGDESSSSSAPIPNDGKSNAVVAAQSASNGANGSVMGSTPQAAFTEKTRSFGVDKGQHRVPFALKHLEAPMKQDGPKRQWTTISTNDGRPRGMSPISFVARGTSYDKSSSPSTSTDSSVDPQVSDTKLEDAVKNLFKTLITPSSRPDADASLSSPSWPELPSISSDQFQAVPRANDDYHDDSTVESGDDLLDD